MSDLVETTKHRDCTGKCEGCKITCDKAKPAPVQSAEEFLERLRSCDYMEGDWECERDEAIQMLESRDAAQRQAGREEAEKEAELAFENLEASLCPEDYGLTGYIQFLESQAKRYAALEVAAREARNDTECFGDFVDGDGNSMQCWEVANITEKEMCSWCRLDKTLADLDAHEGEKNGY